MTGRSLSVLDTLKEAVKVDGGEVADVEMCDLVAAADKTTARLILAASGPIGQSDTFNRLIDGFVEEHLKIDPKYDSPNARRDDAARIGYALGLAVGLRLERALGGVR